MMRALCALVQNGRGSWRLPVRILFAISPGSRLLERAWKHSVRYFTKIVAPGAFADASCMLFHDDRGAISRGSWLLEPSRAHPARYFPRIAAPGAFLCAFCALFHEGRGSWRLPVRILFAIPLGSRLLEPAWDTVYGGSGLGGTRRNPWVRGYIYIHRRTLPVGALRGMRIRRLPHSSAIVGHSNAYGE